MSSNTGDPLTVVEHIIFFKMKDGTPVAQSEAIMSNLRDLRHLDGIVGLHAGPALKIHPGGWTHALFARYNDKDALAAYAVHPSHVKVVEEATTFVEDKLAVDWEASLDAGVLDADLGAARLIVLKWKEGVEKDQVSELMQALGRFPGIKQATDGPNFSPARAKSFQWGFIALFGKEEDLYSLQENKDHEHLLQNSPAVESFVVVDFNDGPARTARI